MKPNLKHETNLLAKIHIHEDYILVFGGLDKQPVKVKRFDNELDEPLMTALLLYEVGNGIKLKNEII